MKNFKDLGNDYEERFPVPRGEEKKVSASFGVMRHIGNVVEHFLGRATDVLVTIAGGENIKDDSKRPPNQGGGSFRGDIPSGPR